MSSIELLRKQVYEANMQLYKSGLVVLTWGNVSGVDRDAGLMAIKPSGLPYEAMKPEDIVLVSLEDGQVQGGTLRPSSDTPTHLALYRQWHDIGGITHTHSTMATAWAQAGLGIPCLGTTHADSFHGTIPCARALTAAEVDGAYEVETGNVIIDTLADTPPLEMPGILLHYHGPFTWGKTPMASVENAIILEAVAAMATYTKQINPQGSPCLRHISEKHYQRKHGKDAYYGQGPNQE